MDYSTEYVMMCEKATELQEMVEHREITQKDFFAKKEGEGQGIWLPRQDQIQEIIVDVRGAGEEAEAEVEPEEVGDGEIEPKEEDNGRMDVGVMIEDIHENLSKNQFAFTLEQACLCLFMKEVYSKYWNIIAKQWEEA